MADLIETNAAELLRGIAAVRRKLDALPDKLQKAALRPATRAAGKVVLNKVKANTPVDEGTLRRSWKLRALRRSRKNKYRVGVRVFSGVRQGSQTFSGDTFYGAFLEFGAPAAGIAPRGFVKRSATEAAPEAKAAFVAELRKRLADVVGSSTAAGSGAGG